MCQNLQENLLFLLADTHEKSHTNLTALIYFCIQKPMIHISTFVEQGMLELLFNKR